MRREMTGLPSMQEMVRAYRGRDAEYDGVFFLGVRTTGVFCRPSCGARKPDPRNVEYFRTPREALFAGYRPCKRCHPMRSVGEAPAWVDRLLDAIDRHPGVRIKDTALRTMNIDPARARRYFKSNYGMTFQAYSRSRRLGAALKQIRDGAPLDDVALGLGYESHSGFRDAFSRTFGVPPGKGHRKESILVTWIDSPLGPLIAGSKDDSIVLLEFTERRMLDAQFASLRKHFGTQIVPGDSAILKTLRNELASYFAGTLKRFTVPVSVPGSPFQREVWEALRRIPYGRTVSYEELARRIGSPTARRAVGRSNGLNRIAIVIPCHRVVAKDGSLGGYGGGLWRKQALLELEQGKRTYSPDPGV
jgi:AraC family transcriptional regulator of adaptative response/methylated-DNA-[protein]-cysteine methyltransferase